MEERVLGGLDPQEVFYWFEEISKYPHGSYHEKPLSDFLLQHMRDCGYEVEQDESWNLRVEVPATPGYEDHPKTILQAHIDMVCKKDPGFEFDFEKDPIPLMIDGDWVTANHTTLGADNGIAVAMILAALHDPAVKHPPLQILFTTIEEVACTGAGRMADDWPDGELLINMDAFRDDAIMVSCAGISIHDILVPCVREALPGALTDGVSFTLKYRGMVGGHSGEVIHEGRANAAVVIGEFLAELWDRLPFRIRSVGADGLFNVICCVGDLEIVVAKELADKARAAIPEIIEMQKSVYQRTDPEMEVIVEERSVSGQGSGITVLSEQTVRMLQDILYLSPAGMQVIADDPCTQASCSSNFGAIFEEDEKLRIVMSIRSNTEYFHDKMVRRFRRLCEMAGAQLVMNRRIGSWEYTPVSPFRDKVARIYEEQNGVAPEIIVIHAGVEVATILAKMEKCGKTCDAVAFGCLTPGCHSTDERLLIASAQKVYRLLKGILEEI